MFVSQNKDVFANQENQQNILGGEVTDLWLQILETATSQIDSKGIFFGVILSRLTISNIGCSRIYNYLH